MTTEIKIDPETGLPAIPEGMFWRVGVRDEVRHPPYWDFDGKPYTVQVDSVMLMKSNAEITKTRKVPVCGDRWYNRNIVVGKKTEKYTEIGDAILGYENFAGRYVYSEDGVPELGKTTGWVESDGGVPRYYYNLPVTVDSVAYLAKLVFEDYLEDLEKASAEILSREERERLMGDYPPKRLGHEEH